MRILFTALFISFAAFSFSYEQSYRIEKFLLEYSKKTPGLPEIPKIEVPLSLQNEIWRGPKGKVINLNLSDLNSDGHFFFSKEALDEIAKAIVLNLNRQGLSGIKVQIDPKEIDKDGKDLRHDYSLTYIITPILVSTLRTKAFGKNYDEKNRFDHYRHEHIIKGSPVKEGELLDKEKLKGYIHKLNRNPRRKVQAVIKEDENKDAFVLHYYVEEEKPWLIHGSVMNTGTRDSRKLNEIFGLINTQFSNHDDTIAFSYFTATFKDVWAIYGSYEYPLPNDYGIKAIGILNDYNSANFGMYTVEYSSHEKALTLEAKKLLWQIDNLFIDIVGGLKVRDLKAHNRIAKTKVQKNYLIPILEFDLNKVSSKMILRGGFSLCGYPNWEDRISELEIENFGRANVNQTWVILNWNWYSSFYLDFLAKDEAYNPHEGVLIFNGQYAFNYRLIPQFRQVLGGLFTVRGYPESIAPGDTSLNLILQYQYHFARGLFNHHKVEKMPQWDFIPFVFVDYGQLINNRRLCYEKNQPLLGTGIGAELRIKSYIIAKGDMGVALIKFRDPLYNADDPASRLYKVNPGDTRFNISLTCMY